MRFARFTGGVAVAVAFVTLTACTSSSTDSPTSLTSPDVSVDNPIAAEMQRLEILYYQGLACREYDESGVYVYVEYAGSPYVDRDRFGTCLTQADVDADSHATDAAITDVTARVNVTTAWSEKASVIIDAYCSMYEASVIPAMQDNYDRLFSTFSELYAYGRTYSGEQYPYSFDEARQWCISDMSIEQPPMEEKPSDSTPSPPSPRN